MTNLIDTSQLLGLDNNNNNSTFNYGFGSNSTNLEYSILSNMLGSPQFMNSSSSSPTTSTINNIWSNSSQKKNYNNNTNDTLLTSTPSSTTAPYTPTTITSLGDPILFSPTLQQQQQQQHHHHILDPNTISIAKMENSPKSNLLLTSPNSLSRKRHHSNSSMISIGYASASKPFSYADGYHYLINYVRHK
ncbi:hypothetical protein HPULCUR_007848 [Helicostylum pulchrum]|uniref:Uncharacterized protein n=1 Tax=Helicostylum pulchrum TaxID=562976 RepID=A0ABP9Y6A9_9FUNG